MAARTDEASSVGLFAKRGPDQELPGAEKGYIQTAVASIPATPQRTGKVGKFFDQLCASFFSDFDLGPGPVDVDRTKA